MSDNACSNSRIIFFLLTGCNHERLPSRERGRHVQQLPCWRRAVGCDGVPGGRRVDRHRDSHQVGGLCWAQQRLHIIVRWARVGCPQFPSQVPVDPALPTLPGAEGSWYLLALDMYKIHIYKQKNTYGIDTWKIYIHKYMRVYMYKYMYVCV